jgi:hypothetical protein
MHIPSSSSPLALGEREGGAGLEHYCIYLTSEAHDSAGIAVSIAESIEPRVYRAKFLS